MSPRTSRLDNQLWSKRSSFSILTIGLQLLSMLWMLWGLFWSWKIQECVSAPISTSIHICDLYCISPPMPQPFPRWNHFALTEEHTQDPSYWGAHPNLWHQQSTCKEWQGLQTHHRSQVRGMCGQGYRLLFYYLCTLKRHQEHPKQMRIEWDTIEMVNEDGFEQSHTILNHFSCF